MLDNKKLEEIAFIMKALSNKDRISILIYLRDKQESAVHEISDIIGIRQPTISQHLILMYRLGVLGKKRHGKETYYRIKNKMVSDVVFKILEMI